MQNNAIIIALLAFVLVLVLTFRLFFPRKDAFKRDLELATQTLWGSWITGKTMDFDYLGHVTSSWVFKIWLSIAAVSGYCIYRLIMSGR